jgi:hypothetical protein
MDGGSGDIVLFEFFIKGTAADPEFGGGLLFVPVALVQNFPEQILFVFRYRAVGFLG